MGTWNNITTMLTNVVSATFVGIVFFYASTARAQQEIPKGLPYS